MKNQLTRFSLMYLLVFLSISACPKRSTQGLKAYQLSSDDGYLGGQVVDLYAKRVLNRRDFSYALAYSPSGHWLAYTHLVSSDFQLSLVEVESGAEQWHVSLNSSEFDVEALAFVDEDHIAVATRRSPKSNHPNIKLLSRIDGHLIAAAHDDDLAGLIQVAVSPDHKILASVSAHLGALILRDAKNLAWLGEIPAHRGAARAVVFVNDKELYTGGDDGRLLHWQLESYPLREEGETQLSQVVLAGQKQAAIPVELPGSGPVLAAIHTGLKHSVISSALAQRLKLCDTGRAIKMQSQAGELEAEMRSSDLMFRDLVLHHVDFAVCDTCLPLGCDLLLGEDLHQRVKLSPGREQGLLQVQLLAKTSADEKGESQEKESTAQAGKADAASATQVHVAAEKGDFTAPVFYRAKLLNTLQVNGSINDLTVSRDRSKLVVALSEQAAERSLQLYEREKAGQYPEAKASNAAVLVDLHTDREIRRFSGPRGYVVTADISPDGKTLAAGAWDNHVMLFDVDSGARVFDQKQAWIVRRLRFAPDGRSLAVASWTPVATFGGDSEPAMTIFDLVYAQPHELHDEVK